MYFGSAWYTYLYCVEFTWSSRLAVEHGHLKLTHSINNPPDSHATENTGVPYTKLSLAAIKAPAQMHSRKLSLSIKRAPLTTGCVLCVAVVVKLIFATIPVVKFDVVSSNDMFNLVVLCGIIPVVASLVDVKGFTVVVLCDIIPVVASLVDVKGFTVTPKMPE
jgi:hypothetical protein